MQDEDAMPVRQQAKWHRIHLADLQTFAANLGGWCLASHYEDAHRPLYWRCSLGHTWAASWRTVRQGKWCPVCTGTRPYKKRHIIELVNLQRVARHRGGKCLATEYGGTRLKVEWECGEGHRFLMRPSQVLYYGSWCPTCARRHNREV